MNMNYISLQSNSLHKLHTNGFTSKVADKPLDYK